jgi:hypothetical protein
MQKAQLDHLLEKTVADALGVRMPQHRRTPTPKVRHIAKAPKRHKQIAPELHPA